MKFDCKEDIIQLSPLWQGERFANGRPKVSDEILRRISQMTIEEIWAPLYIAGYKFQFESQLKRTNPAKPVLVGRAITAVYMPTRPDLANYLMEYAHQQERRQGNFNQWPLEDLLPGDVVVIDMYDKVREGCTLGGNLSTLIANKTETGGAIVWGGIRDLDQIKEIENAQFYYRDTDPTPFLESMLVGLNVPCHIGQAVCMPGDVVLGTETGVLFIPAHMAEHCATEAEKAHVRDVWGFQRLRAQQYTAAQIDSAWEVEMWEEFINWFPTAPETLAYRHLEFTAEIEEAKNGIFRTFEEQVEQGHHGARPATRW